MASSYSLTKGLAAHPAVPPAHLTPSEHPAACSRWWQRGRARQARWTDSDAWSPGAALSPGAARHLLPCPATLPASPRPAHPSSAMALSVGAAPARLPAANTDTDRPGECRRPPRSPRPAPPRHDGPPAGEILPDRPHRRHGRSPRCRREPQAKEGAGLPPHALIECEDPAARWCGGCPPRCLMRRCCPARVGGTEGEKWGKINPANKRSLLQALLSLRGGHRTKL